MTYTAIVDGPDGESRFEDTPDRAALAWDAKQLRLQPVPPSLISPLHPEPGPTMATVLRGWIEITTSQGVTRRFGPGEALLFLDTDGKGHAFAAAPEPSLLLIVRLASGLAQAATSEIQTLN